MTRFEELVQSGTLEEILLFVDCNWPPARAQEFRERLKTEELQTLQEESVVHVGPNGGRYRIVQGRKRYDVA